jgi:chemotaxis protein MotB
MSRAISTVALIGFLVGCVGCVAPRSRLDECYAYNCQLQRKNQEICAQFENVRRQNQELASKNLDLEDRLAQNDQLINNYEQARAAWDRDRDDLRNKAAALMDAQSSLPKAVRYRLEDFARRYPQFVEVDPETGISKFKSDVLFDSGQAVLKPDAKTALHEFASIFQDPSGRSLMIAVVGHTDVRPIARAETKAKYDSNWDLSTDRANAVVKYLQDSGIEPNRMMSAGYSQYQPLVSGQGAAALEKNRRVEIYALSPDTPMVGRTNRANAY